MDIEFCVQNVKEVILAKQYGIKRVELCSALSVGGLTPSIATINACCKASKNVQIHILIRHKEGKFTAPFDEIDILLNDIRILKNFEQVKGIVVGILTDDYQLDIDANKQIISLAKKQKLEVTFHRAFDLIKNPLIVIEQLIDMGVDRILTSGQCGNAYKGIDNIISYVNKAKGRIQIMAACGITAENSKHFMGIGIDAIHFTPTTKISSEEKGMGDVRIIDVSKVEGVLKQIQSYKE